MQVDTMVTPRLEAERVVLRQWCADDYPAYRDYYADPETAQYVGGVKDAQAAWRHMASVIGHWQLRGFGVWAVEEKRSRRFVGCAGFWMPQDWPELEMPFWFLADAYPAGLAAEALRTVLEFGRQRFTDTAFVTYIPVGAAAANGLATSIGGKRTGEIDLFDFGLHAVIKWR